MKYIIKKYSKHLFRKSMPPIIAKNKENDISSSDGQKLKMSMEDASLLKCVDGASLAGEEEDKKEHQVQLAIYKFPSYHTPWKTEKDRAKIRKICNNIDEVALELQEDHNYHMISDPDSFVHLFGDIDVEKVKGVPTGVHIGSIKEWEVPFVTFVNSLDGMELKEEQIIYTKNTGLEGSYHWEIPFMKCGIDTLYRLVTEFSGAYEDCPIYKFIHDTSFYKKGLWRLPNQTTIDNYGNLKTKHEVISGELKQFFPQYIEGCIDVDAIINRGLDAKEKVKKTEDFSKKIKPEQINEEEPTSDKEDEKETEEEIEEKQPIKTEKKKTQHQSDRLTYLAKILNCYPSSWFKDYDNWLKKLLIGVKNEFGEEGYSTFDIISREKAPNHYNSVENRAKWDSIRDTHPNPLTFASILYFARILNPHQYYIIKEEHPMFDLLSIKPKHVIMAKCLYELFPIEFVFQNNKFYCLDKFQFWDDDPNHPLLEIAITDKLKEALLTMKEEKKRKLHSKLGSEQKNSSEAKNIRCQIDYLEKLFDGVKGILEVLADMPFINNVEKCCKTLYRKKEYEIKFNDKWYLFPFKRNVLDLLTHTFRNYSYSDYCSLSTEIDWREPTAEEERVVDRFFETVFPNELVRKAVLILLSTCLEGRRLCKFIIFYGEGSNGKSVLIAWLKLMLGRLGYTASNAILWQEQKMGSCPELANAEKKRAVLISEFPKERKLNVGVVQNIVGDDTIPTRGHYDSGTEKISHMTLILFCNDKPLLEGRINKAILRRIININLQSTFESDDNKVNEAEHHYKEDRRFDDKEFLSQHISALLKKLTVAHQEYAQANYNTDSFIPECIWNETKEYLLECEERTAWFESLYVDLGDDSKEYLALKDVYDNSFVDSDLYKNMKRVSAKSVGINNFYEFFRTHEFYRGRFRERHHPESQTYLRKILLGYQVRTAKCQNGGECNGERIYNYKGKREGLYCEKHKKDGMIACQE